MEILSWETFENHLIGKSPNVLNMGGTRGVRIGYSPLSQSMFIRLPIEAEVKIPPSIYSELETELLKDETGFVIEIRTNTKRLFREFHRFAGIITEDFERIDQSALGAFETAINRWRELTTKKDLLSEDQQLGLHGELAFLRALINLNGPKSVFSWTGRDNSLAERHDFRINSFDFEVKTTRSSKRRHVIHGIRQMQASVGYTLYLISIRFENAGLGLGRSLCEEIGDIRRIIGDFGIDRMEFEKKLLSTGYTDSDAQHYTEILVFADPPVLVSVNEKFPRITTEMINLTLPSEISNRIDDISYRVDVEGLGIQYGTKEFNNILGEINF